MVKTLVTGLQDHLNTRATTMVHCWKVTRTDGEVQGFTAHDNDLAFDGVTYLAASGFTASQVQQNLGLAVDNMEVESALSSDTINEDDLAAGFYDRAEVLVYWVNWQDVSQREIINRGTIGEVKRTGLAFAAELRGLADGLQQKTGLKYQRYCNAVVGDSRCGIDLDNASYKGTGAVDDAVSNRVFTVTGIDSFDDDWFTAGLLTWTSGSNNNQIMEVKLHSGGGSTVTIELWQAMPFTVEAADTFTITAGCKQDSSTCQEKFANIANFRGFNLIPGTDALLWYPKQGDEDLDGTSLINT